MFCNVPPSRLRSGTLPSGAFVFCNVPPSRLRSAGPPRLDAAAPAGGLLSSAFLAHMVRVHGEGGSGQQKSEPKRGIEQRHRPPPGVAAFSRGGPTERKREGGTPA